MAIRKNKLLDSLDQLREQIRKEEFDRTGKTPRVCTDAVLMEIAKNKPLKISDFLAIQGVGKKFVDHYGMRFLQEILHHQNQSVKDVKLSKSAYKVLDHYKDRLTNISRRNPNLYMGKIISKKSFDITLLKQEDQVIEFLTNKRIKNLPLIFGTSSHQEMLQRHITTLYRETNKDEKETGSYDLYIGYPYIEGVFKKDHFAIRAPLLYFPIKLIRNKQEFIIQKDKDKDIIFNRDLLLATSKLEKNDTVLQTPFITDVTKKVIQDIVIPFYVEHGINIVKPKIHFQFSTFTNQLKDQFVKRRKGVFEVVENITVGRYKLYSSMIQKDMNQILDSSRYNDLLEGLIDESNLFEQEKEVNFIDEFDVKEERLSYINDMNYSQEQVIDQLNKEQKLVIWGPPGTGKSQTITSLIASSILKGENVLVVSEKKVALDVIYSRLKEASKYTMFIDDSENKQQFYHKLKDFINPQPPVRTLNNDVYSLEEEINTLLHTLDKSLDLLYNQTILDVEIYKLYSRYVQDRYIQKDMTPKYVHKMFLEVYKKPLVKDMEKLEETFYEKRHLDSYLEFEKVVRKYPIVHKLNFKISRSNKLEFESFTKDLQQLHSKLAKVWVFRKRRLRNKFVQKYRKKLLFLTKKNRTDSAFLKLSVKDIYLSKFILDNMNKINKLYAKHSQLNLQELKFLDMLLTHPLVKDVEEISKYRHYLFDAFYTGYLEEFQAKNQKYLYILDKYIEKMDELNQLISEKKEITIESFEMELYKHALNFSNSKRIMDIQRAIDSNRKMSVKGFIDYFQVELMNHVRVWMMTPEVVSAIIPLIYGMFDLVIFDEASQMYVEKGIPAIYRAKKVVIAGDTKQLRPSSLGIGRLEEDDDLYEEDALKDINMDAKSLLDLARYKYKETILNYHYRSKYEELIAFSNYAFYDGKLIVSPNQTQSLKPPIEYVYVKGGVFDNRRNEQEANEVIKLLKKVMRDRQNNETIGVITFNSTQRDLIENKIDEVLFSKSKYQKLFERELFRMEDNEDQSLFVKNIENVQGDERDIIIFSMGYARDVNGIIHRRFGWLNNEGGQNRLNVAISRAKQKIYFVSSLYPEELKVEDLQSTGPKLLKDYMRYCYYVSHKKRDMAKEVLNKLHTIENKISSSTTQLAQDIKGRLEKTGYTVEENIGIGNYTIDLAIYDETNHEYVLGILCDVSDQQFDSRKELYHQEKYLQSRNWVIHHVFASNYYTNPNKELREIKDKIKM